MLAVVVTEHDPATGVTSSTSWRIDLRAAPRQLAGPLRLAVVTAIPAIATAAQDLPTLEQRCRARLDESIDGYPSASSHVGGTHTTDSDPVLEAATQRIADPATQLVHDAERALTAATTAARDLARSLARLAR